jgi:hypothetical protein
MLPAEHQPAAATAAWLPCHSRTTAARESREQEVGTSARVGWLIFNLESTVGASANGSGNAVVFEILY